MRLDHVQVAIPPGGEDDARSFWGSTLGLEKIPKPRRLAERGGCWFRAEVNEIHCGVDPTFAPATKAHPALEVDDFDAYLEAVTAAGHSITPDELYPGRRRFYVNDPFGNRIEILGPELASDTSRSHPFTPDAWYRVTRDFGITAPDASFTKGQHLRFIRPGGYSHYDGAHLYVFEDGDTGRTYEIWWFDRDDLAALTENLAPEWPPAVPN